MSSLEINEVRKFDGDYFLVFPMGNRIYMWMKDRRFWQRIESCHYFKIRMAGILVAKNHILLDAFEIKS